MTNILPDTISTQLNQLCDRCPTIDREQLFAEAAEHFRGEGAAQFQEPETGLMKMPQRGDYAILKSPRD